jgi:sulfatase maturation enzyme AslB (radical SAM superfamily)
MFVCFGFKNNSIPALVFHCKMKKKLKIAIELTLNKMPETILRFFSNLFSFLKRVFSVIYKKSGFGILGIKLCDFIISRCNGSRFIEFELSNICNAQCVFCPYPDMLRTDKKFMNMSSGILESVLKKIKNFKSTLVSFTPTTGDTLLHPEWNLYITKVLQEKQVAGGTMFTNAIKLDEENRIKFTELINSKNGHKLSEIYFSVGGLDKATYKSLYKVDRFDTVVTNIQELLKSLKGNRQTTGVHIHVKLLKGSKFSLEKAQTIFNPYSYPFVYFSHSNLYFSNDQYTRNAIIEYLDEPYAQKDKACAYLQKTRFAADGSIWADGCVISEMPGDTSLKLGEIDENWSKIESERSKIINNWEQNQVIPKPCQGCTVYRPR